MSVLALILALGVSAFFNLKVYRRAKLYYTRLNAIQLDPDGSRWTRPLPDRDSIQGRADLMIVGDSRAAAWVVPADGRVITTAIDGQTTSQIELRFERELAAYRPRVILIQAGINDLKAIPLLPDRADEIRDGCGSSLIRMARVGEASGAAVVLTTIFPTSDLPASRRLVWSGAVDDAVEEVNRILTGVAGGHIEVIETAPVLSGDDGRVREDFAKDFLHLKESGYRALNQRLEPVLKGHGITFTSPGEATSNE